MSDLLRSIGIRAKSFTSETSVVLILRPAFQTFSLQQTLRLGIIRSNFS